MGRAAETVVIRNRRARYDYLVLDSFECGIVLAGSEVKSIRAGRANLQDAYARVEDGELWLHGMHIAPYEFSSAELDPTRRRKLLLHRKEIDTLARATGEKGVTLVPLRVYFKDGRAKVELAVAKGKRAYDKRRTIAERMALSASLVPHVTHFDRADITDLEAIVRGGFEAARYVHFFCMAAIVLFLAVHLTLTALVPKVLPPMITGRALAHEAHSED